MVNPSARRLLYVSRDFPTVVAVVEERTLKLVNTRQHRQIDLTTCGLKSGANKQRFAGVEPTPMPLCLCIVTLSVIEFLPEAWLLTLSEFNVDFKVFLHFLFICGKKKR